MSLSIFHSGLDPAKSVVKVRNDVAVVLFSGFCFIPSNVKLSLSLDICHCLLKNSSQILMCMRMCWSGLSCF